MAHQVTATGEWELLPVGAWEVVTTLKFDMEYLRGKWRVAYSENSTPGLGPYNSVDGECPIHCVELAVIAMKEAVVDQHGNWFEPTNGMTLRDYFAAAALQGNITYLGMPITREGANARAMEAYEVADAMLRAREESGG
jgi:hypothetical protein